jgi:Carboxypeptidase regulatory-like domain
MLLIPNVRIYFLNRLSIHKACFYSRKTEVVRPYTSISTFDLDFQEGESTMKRNWLRVITLLPLIMVINLLVYGQVTTTSRISGVVMDATGGLLQAAEVIVKNDGNGEEFRVKTGDDGTFIIPSLSVGTYTVMISAPGFKQTVVKSVKTEIGNTVTVEVKLEIGQTSETVVVTGGGEVLQTETTNIGAVITGRQITELPFSSRDALDLVLTLPGTATVGRPRSSSVNGLPKGALNISIDGINVQDNTLRSTDGFFTYIRPRIDAIEEVSVSTATPGAEASAGGAVHLRFVTKAGTNEFHGGAWWYNRQRAYNSNYYFSNLTNTPRAQVMLNQYGFKIGGPITPWLKDRAFFFFDYDEFRLPEQQTRTRTILTPDAQAGIFRYPGGPAAGVNLYAVALAAGFPNTPDSAIGKILADIRTSTGQGSLRSQTDPNLQSFTFTNTGGQVRRFPTARFDFIVTSNHKVEAIYNYQDFAGLVDFLNGRDPAFPSPTPQIIGGQGSDRFSFSSALRSTLTPAIVNEARFGLTGGTLVFFPETSAGSFAPFGGVATQFPLTLTNPYSGVTNSRRNAPVWQFTDNLSWTKGRHNLNFGGSYNKSTFYQEQSSNLVPTLTFGVPAADPANNAIFTLANFPGANDDILTNARAIYALLTGRINQVNFNARLDENTKTYSLTNFATERHSTDGFGFYFQDYFKFRTNLSINYGLRWEAVRAPRNVNEVYVRPSFEGLFGVSGAGNLFKPGPNVAPATTYMPVTKDTKPYDDDLNNFAPSIGIAWSPRFSNSLLKRVFGEDNKSVLRGAYSISYVTGGFADFNGVWNNNPGLVRFAGLRPGIEFAAGSLLLRNGIPALPNPGAPSFPLASSPGIAAFDFDPGIKSPYVQSWSFGIQRELTKDMVFEARYVANHSIGLARNINLNEVNILGNGFLEEFKAAQNNIAICGANSAACLAAQAAAGVTTANRTASNFANWGLPGQVALPIFTASFGGAATASQFRSTAFTSPIQQGQAGAVANSLSNVTANAAFQNNRVAAGFAPNLFIVNPAVLGASSTLQTNNGSSNYNSLQLELRRRFANGLLLQGSYVWSKALTNVTSFGAQPHSIRTPGLDKGPSSFDLRHGFKVNYIYELPFGAGRMFDYRGPAGVIGKLIEGWQTDGLIRWQSGRVFPLLSGRNTVNQFDSGVELVGMTSKELQEMVKINKDPAAATRGSVFWLPSDVAQNTQIAFGLRPGTPTGRYIAPASTPGRFGSFIYLYGPSFFRADLSLVKKTRITEKSDVEIRVELLNAFNHTNFLIGNVGAGDISNTDSNTVNVGTLTFGQTTHAYRDVSTTNDPGGRLLQMVLRINF